jgi:phage FluMu gp28-like protein
MQNEKCSIPNAQWTFLTREVLVLDSLSTPAQLELLRPRLARVRRACIDYTGAGVGLGDLLAHEFGAKQVGAKFSHRLAPQFHTGRIELCHFTAALKQELFPTLRADFERGRVAIPHSSAIREDLHSIQRFVSGHGQISYRATHTADGHSDRATALALALRAADNVPSLACATNVALPNLRHR